MFSVAVCDNDQAELDLARELACRWLAAQGEARSGAVGFLNPEDLARRLRAGERYSVYLLDIIMPGLDGIELGRLVRRFDARAPIIYMTTSAEFTFAAFENHAFQYLLKPLEEERVFATLDAAARFLHGQNRNMIAIRGRQGVETVAAEDVLYVENVSRTPVYTLIDGGRIQGLVNRGTFDEAIAPLSGDESFVAVHKSYWVNMRHIRSVSSNRVVLENGKELPVSRNRSAEVSRRYLKYLAAGGEKET